MRFQTVKRIPGQDPEQVLGVLEDCIRAVSSNDVVRDGRRITFFGLGPSPRAINRRDTTVIDVKDENGGTTIDADVRFQASAFLGSIRQDVVVQEKLDQIFHSMLTQLGLEEWPELVNGHKPHAAVEPFQSEEQSQPASEVSHESALKESHNEAAAVEVEAQAEPLREIAPAAEPELTTEVEAAEVMQPEIYTQAETSEVSVLEEAPAPEPSAEALVEPEAPEARETEETPAIAAKPSEEPAATLAPKISRQERASSPENETEEPEAAKPVILVPRTEPRARIKFESLMAEPESQALSKETSQGVATNEAPAKPSIPHRLPSFEEDNPKSSGWLKWSAWIAAIVVLVVAPAVWLYLPRQMQEEAPQRRAQPQPAAAQPAAVQPAATPAPEQAGANEDPAAVVSQWEDALQSRDAAAQAAFYADPVDRYFLRNNVSKEDVLADRQAAIDKRKGIWTVKMERVMITRPRVTTARVTLIKHYMVREKGSPVSEWFVPSVILLNRQDGRWQITSERDLGWAASMDEVEQ